MSDAMDKLTASEVQELIDMAYDFMPASAFAAQVTLRQAVDAGETAFVDQAVFNDTRRIVALGFGTIVRSTDNNKPDREDADGIAAGVMVAPAQTY